MPPGSARAAPLVVRALMRLYPAPFRERYGAAMAAFYAERFTEAGSGVPRVRVWVRVLVDLAAGVALERARREAAPRSNVSTPTLSTEDRMFVLVQELAYSVRTLRKSVSFSAAAVVTLALGIASTTAIFSVVQSVLLAPLPFPHSDRVVVPESHKATTGATWSVTYADFMDWRDNHVFDKVAVYQDAQMDLTGPSDPVRVSAAAVSAQFFDALGVRPALGRTLQPADFPVDASRAIVISDRLWRRQFGGRPDVIGLSVEVNAIMRPIVGVMPPSVRWPIDADLWVPLRFSTEQDPDLQRRDNYIFEAIARLAPGATLESTRARMATLARLAESANPLIRKDVTTVPVPVLEWALGGTTPRALWILLGAVALLLLIGCVNVANLQLARAAARQRELAVRTALGASRLRLVRQMLVESAVLAAAGGVLAIVLARWMVTLIVRVAPTDVPRIDTATLDAPALAFAIGLSAAVALIFGLVPALHAANSDPQLALSEGGTRTSAGRHSVRTRRALVVVELALSVVLLVGAGLAIRSIARLRQVNTGFDPRNVLTASISIPGIRYDTKPKVVSFVYGLRDRLAAAPGVEAVGIATASPLGGGGFYLGRSMVAEGRDPVPANEVSINWTVTTPGYFAALRVPFVQGRDFTERDDTASTPVMIVNEAFAKAMFPNGDALGKRAMSSRDEKVYREIVGIVRDIKYYGASDTARALVWVPYAQNNAWRQGIITIRTRGAPLDALPVLRNELRAMDRGIALANVSTMTEAMARSMASDRLLAILLGAFASLALVLAAVGIFGVLSYMIAQRTHELGIRLALGAQRRDVVRLVARETMPMVVVGLAIGLGAALGLARFVRSMLYQVAPNDPATFAGVAAVLAAVAVVAALVPARRAARVDPCVALRE
jgi:putative ABC transport system permease protein